VRDAARLIADRFLVSDGRDALDLATGDRVELVLSAIGGTTEQLRWARRCERLACLHHRRIARLIDYGPLGETRRFEAWRSDGVWIGPAREGARARRSAERFLRASGWSSDPSVPWLRHVSARAVVLPGPESGFETGGTGSDDGGRHHVRSIQDVGLLEVSREGVGAAAEVFADPRPRGCSTVAVCGATGSGRDTALAVLARAARLNGFVPIAAPFVESSLASLLVGRSVALLVRDNPSYGWRALARLALLSTRPHVAVFVGAVAPPGVTTITLAPIELPAIEGSLVPGGLSSRLARHVRRAARRSRGLPGRFASLLWGEQTMSQSIDSNFVSRAAESAPRYAPDAGPGGTAHSGDSKAEWPVGADIAVLRSRLTWAIEQAGRGRHASAERALRQVEAALARRHDSEYAARARLALAASFLHRGRPRDALGLLTGVGREPSRTGEDVLAREALLAGLALTDDGSLDEAEAVLSAALVAGERSAAGGFPVALALARCQFWQGRFDRAEATVQHAAAPSTDDEAVRLFAMRCRLAVAQQRHDQAMACASDAAARARASGVPGLQAVAARAGAFAHLAVGDWEATARDVALAVEMARRSHDPAGALRARLIGAESARRQGRRREGQALCSRVGRLRARPLPATLDARVRLLAALLDQNGEGEREIAGHHAQAAGLPALALFARSDGTASAQAPAVADVVSILQCCQIADDDTRVLGGLCVRLRSRLEATGVAVFAEDRGTFVQIAADGGRVESALAPRLLALGQPITPHYAAGRLEAGAPIRYGGRTVGVLLARWTLGRASESRSVALLLATAATAAAPAVAGLAERRKDLDSRTSDLIGTSEAIAAVRETIQRAARAPFGVLIEGESGSGKELVARALHRSSPRRDRPFCTLNCAALPDDLVESELFGHSRGAFTGALAERPGVFEEAHSGTLFLDEIGELSQRAQAKVLRTVQEGEVRRVGENSSRRVDVRLVAATNRDLRREVADGRFRLDLLYRLDVVRITLPPLRARRDDIPLLAEHFWRDLAARVGSRATLGQATLAELARYDWPGNVRELQNVLSALAVQTPRRGVVPPSALPGHVGGPGVEASTLDAARRRFDAHFVRAALARAGGHRARAARELGVTRQGLNKLMQRLGLTAAAAATAER
jgi:DNA-binding NtrC family response regulator/predicted negative regulator of RcsB-dependent stress response